MPLFQHKPVLVSEISEFLAWTDPEASILDLTVGGGGHLRALLENHPRPKLIVACDQDPEALNAARENLKKFEPIIWRHLNFREFHSAFPTEAFDRMIVDLGVSSYQLDSADRGFSFQKPGPLDMRMDPTRGEPASEFLARCDEDELKQILRDYAEEKRAAYFARRLVQGRKKGASIRTTEDFVHALGYELNSKDRTGRHPLTRVFQALRIHVNQEMQSLEELLKFLPGLLRERGRVAILTFHSLEDREVKWSLKGRLKPLNKKVIVASEEEQRTNPRSRSAKLRVYEKLDHQAGNSETKE